MTQVCGICQKRMEYEKESEAVTWLVTHECFEGEVVSAQILMDIDGKCVMLVRKTDGKYEVIREDGR